MVNDCSRVLEEGVGTTHDHGQDRSQGGAAHRRGQ